MDFIVSLSQNINFQKKTLLDYTNLFSPNDYKSNKYFNDKYVKSPIEIKLNEWKV